MGPVLYPNEVYGIVSYLIFLSFKITITKKTLVCISVGQWIKWVNRYNPLSTLISITFANTPITSIHTNHTLFILAAIHVLTQTQYRYSYVISRSQLITSRYIVDQKFNNTKEPQLSWSITALSSDVIHKTTAVPNDIHIISRSQVVEQGFKVFMKYNNKSIILRK